MSVVAVEEGSIVFDVVLGRQAAVDLVADAAQDETRRLNEVATFAALHLRRLNQTVVLSGGGAGDPGILVVDVAADLLSDVLRRCAAANELVDGRRYDSDRVFAVARRFQVQRRRGFSVDQNT